MKVLLLAAGLGTRLAPLTNVTPKCLVTINGKPLLSYWLKLLFDSDLKKILINTHYFSHKVESYINKSIYKDYVSLSFESELLGTAGTIKNNLQFLGNDSVMLIHADNLSIFDMREFINAFNYRPPFVDITMMSFITDSPQSCGILELDENGIVQNMYEKIQNPPGNLANAAVYILSANVIDYIATINSDIIDFSTDVLPKYFGKINTYENTIYHRDIGNKESLDKGNKEITTFNKLFN
jgi:mannose-1-phosphate guanylyltransferase